MLVDISGSNWQPLLILVIATIGFMVGTVFGTGKLVVLKKTFTHLHSTEVAVAVICVTFVLLLFSIGLYHYFTVGFALGSPAISFICGYVFGVWFWRRDARAEREQ